MSQEAERRVGTIIGGKWRVDALLGSGSMAAVYAVTHRNGARAALKILHPTLCTDPAVCERFLGEGYLANSVKHSGIVRVLDDGVTDDGCVFLTMDLLEGDTLEAHRQKRGMKIPIAEALDLGDKLMDVLSAVHTAGIIHRDLKPQNVFVCDDGVLKLLDFGVARVFDRTAQSKLSMFGLVLGTPSFMSPEQALGSRDKVDHRSDIWSFGATLFTVLTGETVHLGANLQAKLLAAATVKARSIAMVMPSLPPAVSAAVDMALRFKKEDRWQSVDVMRRAFREARDNAGLSRPAEPVRVFDMSLDESTHVDKGGPSQLPKAFDGSSTQRLDGEPPEGPSGTFMGVGDKGGSVPPPPAFMTHPSGHPPGHPSAHPPGPRPSGGPPAHASIAPSAHPSASSHSPGRSRSSNAPPLPARARMPSMPAVPGPGNMPFLSNQPSSPQVAGIAGGRAVPAAAGGTGRPPPPVAAGGHPPPGRSSRPGSRPDGQEGSIPAYGNTLHLGAEDSLSDVDPRDLSMRRKSSVGVWLMAVLLAAAALGGIAFFAVKKPSDPAHGGGNGVGPDRGNPATTVTSATPSSPQTTSMLPSTAVTPPGSAPSDTVALTKDASAGKPTPPAVTPTPPVRPPGGFPWKPPPVELSGTLPRNPIRPAPPTPNEPPTSDPRPAPPGLAPDPFGTPE